MLIDNIINSLRECGLECDRNPYYEDYIVGGKSSELVSIGDVIKLPLNGFENEIVTMYEEPFEIRKVDNEYRCVVSISMFPIEFRFLNHEECINFICGFYVTDLCLSPTIVEKTYVVLQDFKLEIIEHTNVSIRGQKIWEKDRGEDFSVINKGNWFIVFLQDRKRKNYRLLKPFALTKSFDEAINIIIKFYQSQYFLEGNK